MQNLTPGAKKLAKEKGISLESIDVQGTGFNGAISEKDLQAFIDTQGSQDAGSDKNISEFKEDGPLEKGQIVASPLAKKMAEAMGIRLADVTNPVGKIMASDVKAAAILKGTYASMHDDMAEGLQTDKSDEEVKVILEKIPYSGVRKIIGDRLSQSKFTAPHLYFTQKVNMEELLKTRKGINEQKKIKLSVTDFISVAVIQTLQQYPEVNASLVDDYIEEYKSINLGIAVAAPSGLIVPVVRHSERMGIIEINQRASELFEKARNGKLALDEYQNGTFTISNLGMVGIENFTAIINPPEAAILSISATKDEPAVVQGSDGTKTIAIKPIMNICLSVDHRIIDGMMAAQFVTEVKNKLEHPLGLLMK